MAKKIETLADLKNAALGILDQATGEVIHSAKMSGYGDDDNGFAPMRIRQYAGEMEALRDLLPECQIRDRMQPAIDALHMATDLNDDAVIVLRMAQDRVRQLGR